MRYQEKQSHYRIVKRLIPENVREQPFCVNNQEIHAFKIYFRKVHPLCASSTRCLKTAPKKIVHKSTFSRRLWSNNRDYFEIIQHHTLANFFEKLFEQISSKSPGFVNELDWNSIPKSIVVVLQDFLSLHQLLHIYLEE